MRPRVSFPRLTAFSVVLVWRAADLLSMMLLLAPADAFAGGPKYVAGTEYFDAGVVGQPTPWAGGRLNYYVDQGPLNSSVTLDQATAIVDAAASLWSAAPTAGFKLTDIGTLNEDVSGRNTARGAPGQFSQPVDVGPSAIN